MSVPGEGPIGAAGMIVGEAPGRDEVEQGRPFVGRSGKLLDTALQALGIPRDSVYVTNVCKELPLDSEGKIRRPYIEEIEEWWPILQGELERVQPRAVLALGRTAAQALTGLTGSIPWGSRIGNVYVAWHPSYVLRDGGFASRLVLKSEARSEQWIEQMREWADVIRAA